MNNREEGADLDLDFTKRGGLLPVVVQESVTGKVLMLAYTNQEAWEKTLKTGMATFFSTSRKTLWTKGETSGDFLKVMDILVDCDQDALVYQVQIQGTGVCHTLNEDGHHRASCFYRKFSKPLGLVKI